MRTPIILIALLALIGIIAAVYAYTKDKPSAEAEPTTFEECAARYPVMESFPRQCNTPSGISFVEDVPETPEAPTPTKAEIPGLITVDAPLRNAQVSSPLTITGEARGYWFFEATFGIEVRNASGTVIAEHYAEALDEWMTEEYVPFRGVITYPAQPSGSSGSVVLKRANASGDPERDQELVIPVTF